METAILYVEMINYSPAFLLKDGQAENRVVMLALSPEQMEQVRPNQVGAKGGQVMFESVRPISIQFTEAAPNA